MIDPAWASVAVIGVTSAGSWIWLLKKNGKSMANWQGTIDTKIENMEKSNILYREDVKENLKEIRNDIKELRS